MEQKEQEQVEDMVVEVLVEGVLEEELVPISVVRKV